LFLGVGIIDVLDTIILKQTKNVSR